MTIAITTQRLLADINGLSTHLADRAEVRDPLAQFYVHDRATQAVQLLGAGTALGLRAAAPLVRWERHAAELLVGQGPGAALRGKRAEHGVVGCGLRGIAGAIGARVGVWCGTATVPAAQQGAAGRRAGLTVADTVTAIVRLGLVGLTNLTLVLAAATAGTLGVGVPVALGFGLHLACSKAARHEVDRLRAEAAGPRLSPAEAEAVQEAADAGAEALAELATRHAQYERIRRMRPLKWLARGTI
jgi:hypothetical protein